MYAAILRALALACVLGSSMALSNADLGKVFGRRANPVWLAACTTQWDAVVRLADLSTPLRQAHFLAQVAHESAGCRVFEENLNYSAARLRQVWPSRFPTLASTRGYARNPRALANKVYASRMGNGGEVSGDGWLFRGRSPIQATGRDMYRQLGRIVGIDLEAGPDQALDPAIGWLMAAAVWRLKDCNRWADRDDIVGVRKRINGGKIGLAETRVFLLKSKKVVQVLPQTAVKGDEP